MITIQNELYHQLQLYSIQSKMQINSTSCGHKCSILWKNNSYFVKPWLQPLKARNHNFPKPCSIE